MKWVTPNDDGAMEVDKPMRTAWLCGLIGLALVAGGVKSVPSDSKRVRAADYYPLVVGNSWTYDINMLGEQRSMSVKIDSVANGFYRDSTGAELVADAFGVRDQKRYLLREPIEVGTTWTNVVSVSSVERYQITSAGLPCESPAGKFDDCVVVESRNRASDTKTLVNDMTFARGVGMVRVAMVLENNGQIVPQTTLVLTSYTAPTVAPAVKTP